MEAQEFKMQVFDVLVARLRNITEGLYLTNINNQFDETRIHSALNNLRNNHLMDEVQEKYEAHQKSEYFTEWKFGEYINYLSTWEAPELDNAWVD